jgi:hypothetical protein
VNAPEVFIITLLGVASGCLVNAGFILQMVYAFWIKGGSGASKFLFHGASIVIGFSCGMAPVFMLFLIVMGSGWDWSKFGYFAFVTVLAMGVSIYGFHKISAKLNPLISAG